MEPGSFNRREKIRNDMSEERWMENKDEKGRKDLRNEGKNTIMTQ